MPFPFLPITDYILTGVLSGSVHGGHPGALLTGCTLLHGKVDEVCEGDLVEAAQSVLIHVIVLQQALWGGGGGGQVRGGARCVCVCVCVCVSSFTHRTEPGQGRAPEAGWSTETISHSYSQ